MQTPDDKTFQHFEQSVSAYRLKRYRKNRSDAESVALYLWNIALCEALYPSLNFFEVAYRNALHNSLSARYALNATGQKEKMNNPRWFMDALLLQNYDQISVNDAIGRLRRKRKNVDSADPTAPYPVEPQRVVAELNFGFWVNLYSTPYMRTFFGVTVADVFPRSPKSMRVQGTLYPRLEEVLDLRNRISHHEPIYHWTLPDAAPTLQERVDRIREAIGWMDDCQPIHRAAFSHFDTVHNAGWRSLIMNTETSFTSLNIEAKP